MGKMKGRLGNDFCPQPLFLYGNYQADGTPHFGLFCWFSYCTLQDGEEEALGVMACIGEEKLTKEIARAKGMLSNEKFLSKAPEKKVQEEKEKLEKYTQMLAQVQERMAGLKKI